MLVELNEEQRRWVENTLNGMSMEECVGNLICPEDRSYSVDDWREVMRKIPLGSAFLSGGSRPDLQAKCRAIQEEARIPVMIAADMECGANAIKTEATKFPTTMACAATDSPELMFKLGRITALESRSCGIHWTFSPVADLNINFNNPLVNTRSLGDNPDKVIPLLQAFVRGLQQDGLMAATVKHFPGDGVDDRDQHMCTTVNALPFDQWMELYGRVWQAAFDAGCMSVMAGHISLPDWQQSIPDEALPATLCPKIQIDLLRKRLGFEGLLVSDAAPMIGMTSRCIDEELAWRNIAAGSDVLLFAKLKDYDYLLQALRDKKITEEQVMRSTRHVLETKARLNLHHDAFAPQLTAEQMNEHSAIAGEITEKSITQIKARPGLLPVKLRPGAKVLTVTLSEKDHPHEQKELTVIDEELRLRGLIVDHKFNPGSHDILQLLDQYDKIFVNFYMTPWMRMCTMRMSNAELGIFWHSFALREPDKSVFTSFGTPYTLYEVPHLNNMLLTYSPSEESQRAAVKVWLGELSPVGSCPVKMPQTTIRRFC